MRQISWYRSHSQWRVCFSFKNNFFAKKILHLNHSQKSRGNKRKLFSSFFVKYIIDFRVREKIKGFALVAIRAVTEKFCCVVLCAKSVRA